MSISQMSSKHYHVIGVKNGMERYYGGKKIDVFGAGDRWQEAIKYNFHTIDGATVVYYITVYK